MERLISQTDPLRWYITYMLQQYGEFIEEGLQQTRVDPDDITRKKLVSLHAKLLAALGKVHRTK